MVICLESGADLHMAQLMPLPLIVSCFSKIQIGFTFLVSAHPGSPGKGPLNGCVCVAEHLVSVHTNVTAVVSCRFADTDVTQPVASSSNTIVTNRSDTNAGNCQLY